MRRRRRSNKIPILYLLLISIVAYASDYSGSAPLKPALGTQKLTVLLLQFAGETAPAYDRDGFDAILREVNAFYQEASYGKFSYTWAIGGPLLINSPAPCSDAQELDEAPAAARSAAASAGIDLSASDVILYAGSGCGPARGAGSSVYLFQTNVDARIVAHELGHTLGLGHADLLQCPAGPYAPDPVLLTYQPSSSGCTRLEYGDQYDVMGDRFHHFNAAHKHAVGWIDPLTASTTGVYEIGPLEAPGPLPAAIRIAPDTGPPFYIEYRQPIGFDRYDPDFTLFNGVFQGASIHVGRTPSALLAMEPANDPQSIANPIAATLKGRPALVPGESYVDPVQRFKIKVLSATPEKLQVEITMLSGASSPKFSFGSPLEGMSVSATVAVGLITADPNGASSIDVSSDGQFIGTATQSGSYLYSLSWDTSKESPGPHQLTATAHDPSGGSFTQTIPITLHQLPQITITALNRSVIPGTPVMILSQTSVDPSAKIASVEFTISGPVGVQHGSGSQLSPTVSSFEVTPDQPGVYSVSADLLDDAGFKNWSNSAIITAAPVAISTQGVVNAANFRATISPGGLVSIFGGGFGTQTDAAESLPLPMQLGGVSVTVGGFSAPLLFTSPRQINVQIPWELASGCTSPRIVQVVIAGPLGTAQNIATCNPASPGIFRFGIRQAVAINLDGSIAAPAGAYPGIPSHPAKPGDVMILLGTGFGAVTPAAVDGANSLDTLRPTVATPTVTIGGLPATVEFAGMSPEFPGVNQINVRIPDSIAQGDTVPLNVAVGNSKDSTVTVAIATD